MTIEFIIGEVNPNDFFSAPAANRLFDQISFEILESEVNSIIEFNFLGVEAVSTSFAGRFRERVVILKSRRPDLKFKMKNVLSQLTLIFKQ